MDFPWFRTHGDILTLHLYIQPNARSTAVAGLYQGVPKIRVAAPALDNKANAELLAYLQRVFDVPRKQIALIKGEQSRHKVVEIIASAVPATTLLGNMTTACHTKPQL